MVGVLVKSTYKYKDVSLSSGAVVTALEVTTKEGKVLNIPNGEVRVDDKMFNFSIYGETYNLNGVPKSVDGQAIVEEFVTFVESDIA